MPFSPSEPFLLWHEAAVTGRWRKLLNLPATKDRIWALWMLQNYALKPLPAESKPVTREEALAAAVASGWGK